MNFRPEALSSTLIVCLAALIACAGETPSAPWGLSTQIRAANGQVLDRKEVNRFIEEQIAELGSPGLSPAIISDGAVTYHRVFGVANSETGEPITDASIFESASLSKPVFAYFVMQLVDAGVLDPDVPLWPSPSIKSSASGTFS